MDTVELTLNGRSLGEKKFDTKTTACGARYLETTEASGDDKTVTSGRFPGSYTSPNGSAGKLHLAWTVPFQPGRLVPGADNLISFQVSGGSLAVLGNGRQESAENYQASSRTAFNGKALAMVRSGQGSSAITVTARAPGLQTGTDTIATTGARLGIAPAASSVPQPQAPPAAAAVTADASYSGASSTIPAAMLDGNGSTRWSNYYNKSATALLPAVSRAHASEWVSFSGLEGAPISSVQASFVIDSSHALPAAISVSYWNGTAFAPVRDARIQWATESGRPTRVTFTPVSTGRIRLDLTSRSPGTTRGFLGITEVAAGR